MSRLVALPSQTVGPFFHFALTTNAALGVMAGKDAKGERIRLKLRLLDGEGAPVPDGIFELWQADANGVYQHPGDARVSECDQGFHGFGRLQTDNGGVAIFETVRPGRVTDDRGGWQSPHINVTVFARGLCSHLFTRIYFEGDSTLDSDYALGAVPAERRATLIAQPGGEPGLWIHDIRLQGADETVFFDF
ncbi:MAG TPA: protocatechuate 3,4-dioxygenase subunit alpha [Bryobacteraceae bacterium]|nr:protocatechuate 3,4-dioxygenase subunit alpha [Bryobacteraceae bacterium]